MMHPWENQRIDGQPYVAAFVGKDKFAGGPAGGTLRIGHWLSYRLKAGVRSCEKIKIRRRNRLRHQWKSFCVNGGAGGFACPGRLRPIFSQLLTLLAELK